MSKLFNISEKEKNRVRKLHLLEHTYDGITPDIINNIEEQLKLMTGEYASISNRGEEMRAKFTYITWEFDNEVWDGVLDFLRIIRTH